MRLTTSCFTLLFAASAVLPVVVPADPNGQERQLDWQSLAPLTAPLFEAAGAVHQGKLYVFGGFGPGLRATNRCDSYDPETNTWTRLADMPQALTHLNAVVDGHEIWTAGGFETNGRGPAVANVWKYDIETDTFEAGPPLPAKRAGGGLARVGRKLHYISGLTEDRDTDSPEHWTLDLDGGTEWTPAPPMPMPRNQFGVAVVGTRIYAIGGQFHHDRNSGRGRQPQDQPLVHVFDTETELWAEGPPLPLPLSHIETSTFALGNDIIAVGGRSINRHSNQIWALSVESNQWRKLGELPNALRAPVANVVNGKLILGGGALPGYDIQDAMWSTPLTPETIDDPEDSSPVAYTRASIDRGKNIYLRFCAECHDRDGKSLTSTIANATDLTVPEEWLYGTTDREVFTTIRNGAGDDMPPFEHDIRDEEHVWHIVNFLKSIGPKSRRPVLKQRENDV